MFALNRIFPLRQSLKKKNYIKSHDVHAPPKRKTRRECRVGESKMTNTRTHQRKPGHSIFINFRIPSGELTWLSEISTIGDTSSFVVHFSSFAMLVYQRVTRFRCESSDPNCHALWPCLRLNLQLVKELFQATWDAGSGGVVAVSTYFFSPVEEKRHRPPPFFL